MGAPFRFIVFFFFFFFFFTTLSLIPMAVRAVGRNPVGLTQANGGRTLLLQRGGLASAPLADGDVLRLVVDRNEFTNMRRWERWAGNPCAYRVRLLGAAAGE